MPRLEYRPSGAVGNDLVALVEDHQTVAFALGVEMRHVEIAGRVEVLAVLDHGSGAARAEVGQARPPGGVLPEVRDPRTRVERGQRDGARSSTRRTGGAGDQLTGGAVTTPTRTGPSRDGSMVRSVACPSMRPARTIGEVQLVQDPSVRMTSRRPVLEEQVQLGAGGDVVAVGPGGACMEGAHLALVPAVGEHEFQGVLAGVQRRRHIRCLRVHRLVVRGGAR